MRMYSYLDYSSSTSLLLHLDPAPPCSNSLAPPVLQDSYRVIVINDVMCNGSVVGTIRSSQGQRWAGATWFSVTNGEPAALSRRSTQMNPSSWLGWNLSFCWVLRPLWWGHRRISLNSGLCCLPTYGYGKKITVSTWTIFEISLLHILCVVTIPNRVYRLNTVAAIFVFWQTIPHPPTPNFLCFWRHYLHKCLASVFGTVRGGLELLLHCLKPDTWTEWMVSCSLQHLHIIRSEINDICCSDISTLYKLPDHLVFHLDNPPVCYVQCSKKPKRLALLLVRTLFWEMSWFCSSSGHVTLAIVKKCE